MRKVDEMIIDFTNRIDEGCLDYDFQELSLEDQQEFLNEVKMLIDSYFLG
jgi:hypothetical protein